MAACFLLIGDSLFLNTMEKPTAVTVFIDRRELKSVSLKRVVMVDVYLPAVTGAFHLLLFNDGQSMEEAGLKNILEDLYHKNEIAPLCSVAIHAGEDRKNEYGIAAQTDYLGRGAKAADYHFFILKELLPWLRQYYKSFSFTGISIAGFSLGGLTAMDIGWIYPEIFSKVGIFSGSFWWRSVSQENELYEDDKHRIMQQQIRNGSYHPGLKFFFQCGNKDETQDRNGNGIIDSIDDTLDIIKELEAKGYQKGKDIAYLEMPDGRHDMATWAKALPVFLKWGWGKVN